MMIDTLSIDFVSKDIKLGIHIIIQIPNNVMRGWHDYYAK